MKVSTVALVISFDSGSPFLVETLHDEYEIEYMEVALRSGEVNPLAQIYEHREQLNKKESDFGDYVEDLLSQPFLHPEIQKHGIQWLKSKIKIENYQKTENEAVKVISDYAYSLFKTDPTKIDFFLASPTSQVRIRVFMLPTAIVSTSPLSKVG